MSKFKEMSLLELAEYWNKDWSKEEPELDNDTLMREWESAVPEKIRCASELEILQFLHELREVDYLDVIGKARDGLRESIVWELTEKLGRVEKSLKVLLKETEAEQIPHDKRANITPAQLSRLKGGL